MNLLETSFSGIVPTHSRKAWASPTFEIINKNIVRGGHYQGNESYGQATIYPTVSDPSFTPLKAVSGFQTFPVST